MLGLIFQSQSLFHCFSAFILFSVNLITFFDDCTIQCSIGVQRFSFDYKLLLKHCDILESCNHCLAHTASTTMQFVARKKSLMIVKFDMVIILFYAFFLLRLQTYTQRDTPHKDDRYQHEKGFTQTALHITHSGNLYEIQLLSLLLVHNLAAVSQTDLPNNRVHNICRRENKVLIKIQIKCKESGGNIKAVSGCQGNNIEWSVLMRQSCFSQF